jgi:hypothetical protein
MDALGLWRFLPIGYLITIAMETPALLIGLSRAHSISRRIFAGVWLTACTYPIVVLVLPLLLARFDRWVFLLIAESFAPLAECAIFAAAFHRHAALTPMQRLRDFTAIALANLASFAGGEMLLNALSRA